MARAELSSDELEGVRSQLATAGLALYRSHGVDAVSFRRIAEVVGASHTMPYRYFDGKESLMARMRLEALKQFGEFVLAAEEGVVGPLQKARAVAYGYMNFAKEHTAEYMLIFATHQPDLATFPEVLKARQDVFEHAVGVLEECVAVGAVLGEPRELAHALWVSMHGLMTLHSVNQLVHGMKLDELVEPLLARLLASATV